MAHHISLTPSSDASVRRATRVFAMVHELHKAGYQLLRVCFGTSADGGTWRCSLLSARHVNLDGWTPRQGISALRYESDGAHPFFGWRDASGKTARELAFCLLERQPRFMATCLGRDWAYAGWLTELLGPAENGLVPALYGGFEFELHQTWLPAPPPPPASWPEDKVDGEAADEYEPIPNEALTTELLPPSNADYDRLWPFCLSYDGYRAGLREVADCFYVADRVMNGELRWASMDNLRTTAFIHQRKLKNADESPLASNPSLDVQRSLDAIRRVVEEIRCRLEVRNS